MILLLFSVIPGLIAVYLIYLIRVYIRLFVYNYGFSMVIRLLPPLSPSMSTMFGSLSA